MATNTITFHKLTKQYGNTLAVNDLTANVSSGKVTGFLGPNGAGKSTALRCLLNLVNPTSGNSLIKGMPYRELENPMRTVGAVLDSRGYHPGLTAQQNLNIITTAAQIPKSRIDEVLNQVELSHARDKRTKGFSLGMKQRLSLAIALLGDPEILILDEPANGLDPQGIVWLRNLLKELAKHGKTVLVSSHQLAEMQHTVDDVLIINQGRLIAEGSMVEICGDKTLEEAFLELTSRVKS